MLLVSVFFTVGSSMGGIADMVKTNKEKRIRIMFGVYTNILGIRLQFIKSRLFITVV